MQNPCMLATNHKVPYKTQCQPIHKDFASAHTVLKYMLTANHKLPYTVLIPAINTQRFTNLPHM